MSGRCFLCGRPLESEAPDIVDTRDGQTVYVGPDCYRRVLAAGDAGVAVPDPDLVPGQEGLRLYPLKMVTGRLLVRNGALWFGVAEGFDHSVRLAPVKGGES